jgi:hypothetical protein
MPAAALVAGVIATALAYWIGLGGPFLLDDPENFVQLARYARGEVTWLGPVMSNGSGPLGRPLSMASLVASVWAGGFGPWPIKAGNLFLHVSTGALVGWLALLIVRRDPQLAGRAGWIAVLVAIVWLLLPIHVSTVLYAVQRMTIVAGLLTLVGLIGYVTLRERLDRSGTSTGRSLGWLALWLGVATALAGHAKENGLLLPLLCAVLELTVFRTRTPARRAALAIVVAGAAVGLVGLIAVLWQAPDALLGGYGLRDFTLAERLLTQPRILWDYVRSILVPHGPRMGLIHDDIAVSRSLLSPWTTSLAIAGWIAVVALAIAAARRSLTFSTGVLLFVAGHAMESTFLPLELYFEHRNYLPSVGVLLALTGLVAAIGRRLPPASRTFHALRPVLAGVVIGVYAFALHARATVWGDAELLAMQTTLHRAESPRTQTMLFGFALEAGAFDIAREDLDRYDALTDGHDRAVTDLWRLHLDCLESRPLDVRRLDATRVDLPLQPGPFALKAAIRLAETVEAGGCPDMADPIGALLIEWSQRLEVPPTAHASWRFRYLAARLAATREDWAEAIPLAISAWEDSGWNNGIGVFVVQLANSVDDRALAAAALRQLEIHAPSWDLQLRDAIAAFRAYLGESVRGGSGPQRQEPGR